MYVGVQACAEVRGQPWYWSSRAAHLAFEAGFLSSLKLTKKARLAGQQAPRNFLFLG